MLLARKERPIPHLSSPSPAPDASSWTFLDMTSRFRVFLPRAITFWNNFIEQLLLSCYAALIPPTAWQDGERYVQVTAGHDVCRICIVHDAAKIARRRRPATIVAYARSGFRAPISIPLVRLRRFWAESNGDTRAFSLCRRTYYRTEFP